MTERRLLPDTPFGDRGAAICERCETKWCCTLEANSSVVTRFDEKELGQALEGFTEEGTHPDGVCVQQLRVAQGESKQCVFWDRDLGCTVHADRLIDCRLFPLDVHLENEEYWWIVYDCDDCPLARDAEALEIAMRRAEEEILSWFGREFSQDLRILATKNDYHLFAEGKWRKLRKVRFAWSEKG